MSRVALIAAGVVANVIEADLQFAQSLGYDDARESDTAGPGWLLVGDDLVPPAAVLPGSLEDAKADLRARATALRWERETGGIDVAGVRVATGVADQNRIASVLVAAPASIDFKAESGWVSLTIEQLRGIADAIAAHVQACFSAERAHHEAIDTLASIEEAQAYDVTAGWPE